ncbi:MAG: spore photoproduct lyase family protein, partial [Pseudomonadota bacterium]
QTRLLENREPIPNCVTAFSFTPDPVSRALEHRVPSVEKRLDAMGRLAERGWPLGLRFDPLIHHQDYQDNYRDLFARVFARIPEDAVHSVSLGPFRLPRTFFRTITRLYPAEPLFAGQLEGRGGMISYPRDVEEEMVDFCTRELLKYLPPEKLFPCLPDHV